MKTKCINGYCSSSPTKGLVKTSSLRQGRDTAVDACGPKGAMLSMLFALLLGIASVPAWAQSILDAGFFSAEHATAFAVQPDGKIVVGGNFATVRRLNSDGSLDATFASAPTDASWISAILPLADGKLLIAGQFSNVSGQPAKLVARLNADGTFDSSFAADFQGTGVTSFIAQPDGKILIAGQFSSVFRYPSMAIVRLNANGSVDTTFTSPVLSTEYNSVIGSISAIALRPDGKILAVGKFFLSAPNANADNVSTVIRINTNGTVDADLTGIAGIQSPLALAAQPDGRVLVTGVGVRQSYAGVVRLNANDTLDVGFNPQLSDPALTLFVQPNGKIVLAGAFTSAGGQPHKSIARLNADGSADTSFDPGGNGGPYDGSISALMAQADGKLLIGGDFTAVGAQQVSRPGLARLLVPEAAVQQVGFGDAGHSVLRLQRDGSGIEFGRVVFDTAVDGTNWVTLGEGSWQAGAWSIALANAPAAGHFWARAHGYATGGGGTYGFSGANSVIAQQLIATVTPGADAGGSIAPSAPQDVDTGSTTTFTIAPASGQQIQYVDGSCGGALDGNNYATPPITGDCTVQAHFSPAGTFTVTPHASAGGIISPDLPQSVNPDGILSFTLMPATGHLIGTIGGTCGGTLSGNVYTTAPITANCTIDANFTLATYTVQASTGGNGAITPISQTVNYGDFATLSVTPDLGYNASASGCGGTLNGATYATAAISANCTVAASFAPIGSAGALVVTLAPYVNGVGPVCGTQSTLVVNQGDYVTFCYTYTNQSGQTLPWHYFADSAGIVDPFPYSYPVNTALANGDSASFFSNAYVFKSQGIATTWTALADVPPRYEFDDTAAFDWIELAASPTAALLPIDTQQPFADTQVEIPFPFYFYGLPTDGHLCVDKNGTLRFSSGLPCSSSEYWYRPKMAIVAAGTTTDTYSGGGQHYTGGRVYYEVQGNAPHRHAIVEWSQTHLPLAGVTGNPLTYEAILDEATGMITLQYLSMDTGNSSTANGAAAYAALLRESPNWAVAPDPVIVYSDHQPRLVANKAVRFMPSQNPFIATTTAMAQVMVATPVATVTPSSLAVSAAPGASTSISLTIGNVGNAPLAWNIGRSAGATGVHITTPYAVSAQMPAARVAAEHWKDRTSSDGRPVAAQASGSQPAKASLLPAETRLNPAVSAYGLGIQGDGTYAFAVFDATAPGTITAASKGDAFSAIQVGAFVDNDFSREYVATNGFCGTEGCFASDFGYMSTTDGTHRTIAGGPEMSPYVPGVAAESWGGIKWDQTTHMLYGVATNAGSGNAPSLPLCGASPKCRSDLFTINPATGTSTWLAQIDAIDPTQGTLIADIAIASDGTLYALNMIDDSLYAIDKSNGHVRPVGPTGLNIGYWPWQSMDFDQTTGILYYATWPSGTPAAMYTIDSRTGTAAEVGQMAAGTYSLRGLAIAKPGGPCAQPSDLPWLSFDTAGGAIDPNGSKNVTVTFNAGSLTDGVYNAKICVNSNTQFTSTIAVPVMFTVGHGDRIFANGFESTLR
jgi:uncharacterized delta-60 repeat protein